MNLPIEIFQIIFSLISSKTHDSFYQSCKYFNQRIYSVIDKVTFHNQDEIDTYGYRYHNLRAIKFHNCFLPLNGIINNSYVNTVIVDFPDKVIQKKNSLNSLFYWISQCPLKFFESNIDILPAYAPKILGKKTLKHVDIKCILTKNFLDIINPKIHAMATLIMRTEECIDLSDFHHLRVIKIVGNLSPKVIQSLQSIPTFFQDLKIEMTLFGIKNIDVDMIQYLPIESLNLSNFNGDISVLCFIRSVKRIIFPARMRSDNPIIRLFSRKKDLLVKLHNDSFYSPKIVSTEKDFVPICNLVH